MSQARSPVSEAERAEVLDAMRGFALLGILVTHVPDFSGYTFLSAADQAALDRFGLDVPLAMGLDFFVRGKFLSLFSLLFGIGFSIQLESAIRRGDAFAVRFSRRLAGLFIIGIVHAFLWYGDILKDYALIGFVLLAIGRARVSTVAAFAALTLALRIAWPAIVMAAVPYLGLGGDGGDPASDFSALVAAAMGQDVTAALQANAELVGLKMLQLLYEGRVLLILFMFLVGALIGKLGIHRNITANRALLDKTLLICGPIGLLGGVVLLPLHHAGDSFPPTFGWVIEQSIFAVATPALTLTYASAFALLWTTLCRRMLAALAPTGRTALTSYVSQTLVGLGLFYGVGLNLHGQIGLAAAIGLAVVIFSLQTVAARIWLQHFHFGPLEWAWRSVTYGSPVRLLRGNDGVTFKTQNP